MMDAEKKAKLIKMLDKAGLCIEGTIGEAAYADIRIGFAPHMYVAHGFLDNMSDSDLATFVVTTQRRLWVDLLAGLQR